MTLLLLLLVLLTVSSHGKTWLEPSAASLLNEVTFGYEPSVMVRGSNVICTENGVFPILDSCEDYYHCTDWDGRGMQIYHFTCPQGTIFEDQFDNCHSPTVGITRPGCENVTYDVSYATEDLYSVPLIERHKRSLPPQEDPTNERNRIMTEIIAESAKDTCILIYHVDNYVRRVRAMSPVILPGYVNSEIFIVIVNQYNNHLKMAQTHTYIWRHEDDIMSGIRQTYQLAQVFAPEFERKHQIMQNIVDKYRNSSMDTINRALDLETEIEFMKEDKVNITSILSEGGLKKFLQKYFRKRLKSIDKGIAKKENELNELDMPVIKTLKELVHFMQFVKDDAGRIEAKARSTRTKVKIFKDHVLQDKEGFARSIELASTGLLQLESERNYSLALIAERKDKIKKVEEEKKNQTEAIRQLQDNIDEVFKNLQEELSKLNIAMDEALKKDNSEGWKISWTGIEYKVSNTDNKVRAFVQRKKNEYKSFELSQQRLESRIKRADNEVILFRKQIESEEGKIEKEKEKLHKLRFVDFYLHFVIDDSDMILPFITKALVSLELIEEIFDDIVLDLGALISRAKIAKSEIEMQNIQYVIYEGLSDMKERWNASYANIISLGRCTHDDVFQKLTQPPEPITTTTETPVNTTVIVDPLFNNTLSMDLLTPTDNSTGDTDSYTVSNSTEDTDSYTVSNSTEYTDSYTVSNSTEDTDSYSVSNSTEDTDSYTVGNSTLGSSTDDL